MLRLLCGCLLIIGFACKSSDNTTKPIRKDLIQAVYASGKIFPINHVRIASKVSGYISKILVKPGDTIVSGMPLMVISNPNNEVNIDIAKRNLRLSELNTNEYNSQIDAAKQDIQSAYSKYQLDSTNYERYKNLWKQDIGSRATVDQYKTQTEVSWQLYRKALSNLQSIRDRLQTDAANAKNQLKAQVNNSSDYTITAPFSGRVYDILIEEGQLVTMGTVVADIGQTETFEAELDVDESDIAMVQLGQEIILNAEAYSTQPIHAVVKEIYPSVVAGNKSTKVKASINSDSLKLFSGMSVEANIIVDQKKNVLVVPVEYVVNNTVTLKKNKQKIAVKTGIKDMQYVEIISGIDENAELIKPEK